MKWNIKNHLEEFPHSCVVEKEDRLYGCFMIGNYYKRKNGYHGEYPPKYLDRVQSLFPDREKVLHLFSGSVESENDGLMETWTFDSNPNLEPDIIGDAEWVSNYFYPNTFDLILADPPYRERDAEIYECRMPRVWKVMKEARRIIKKGGFLIWLDIRKPMYRKTDWRYAGMISLDCGTNRIVRGVFIFEAI